MIEIASVISSTKPLTEGQLEQTTEEATTETSIEEVLALVGDKFPNYSLGVEVSLSAMATLLLQDNANPAFLIKEGPAACGKTTIDNMIGHINGVTVWSDSFTPRSFLSHRADCKEEQLQDIDLLRRIRHKVLITPDLAPTLNKRGDDLRELIGIITRVLDGQGLETDSGAHGHRSAVGDYLFVWLASTTPLGKIGWSEIGKAGTRTLIFDLPRNGRHSEADDLLANILGRETYREKVTECRKVVNNFIVQLIERYGNVRGVTWPRNDDVRLLRAIESLTKLCVDWRAMSQQGEDIIKDSPQRHIVLLYNLARGHALLYDRLELTEDDVTIVARIATDSIPHWRRPILRAMIREWRLDTPRIQRITGVSRTTALGYMEELAAVDAVHLDKSEEPWSIEPVKRHYGMSDTDKRWLWKHLPC
ncbi:hypothetical protein ACFLVI_04350 [Chloroflexota bacterium]